MPPVPPSHVDNQVLHLYKPFYALLKEVLDIASRECAKYIPQGGRLGVFEGYRSTARQQYLYAQGRTTPGSVVTNNRIPDHHGHGLAADIVIFDKAGNPSWDFPDGLVQQFGHCVRSLGLEYGGDWPGRLGDVYHVQANHAQMSLWEAPADKYLHSIGLTTP